MKNKIGVLLDNYNLPLYYALEKASKSEVDGVQFYLSNHKMSSCSLTMDKIKATKFMLKSYPFEIASICGDLGGDGFQKRKDNYRKVIEMKKIIDAANLFETNIITTHIGVLTEQNSVNNCVIADAMIDICSYAERKGVYIAVETGPEKSWILSSFIHSLGERNLRVNLDPANLVMVQREDPVKAVKNLGDLIIHTHVKDGVNRKICNSQSIYDAINGKNDLNLENYFIETPIGTGTVDFKRYLSSLKNIHYKGYLTVECELHGERELYISNGINYIREMEAL